MTPIKLTISQLAELLGLPVKTIRHYHEVGVLPEPERGENGYRLYSGADLKKLQTIRELQSFGLTLKQIHYILTSDEPDIHLRGFLVQRDQALADEIDRLQRQQARVRAVLSGEAKPIPTAPSSQEIVHHTLKTVSHTLADVLIEIEAHVLTEIDHLPHHPNYAQFWEQTAHFFAQTIRADEPTVGLWLERYLALGEMQPDDRQAQSWLDDLHFSPSAALLGQAFDFPANDTLPLPEQLNIHRLLPMLLYEHASPLQKAFLNALRRGSRR